MGDRIRIEYEVIEALSISLMNYHNSYQQRNHNLDALHDQVRAYWVGASSDGFSNWWKNVDYPARVRLTTQLEHYSLKGWRIKAIVQQHDQDCAALVKQLMAGQ